MEPLDIEHLEAATFGDRALQREVLGLFDAQAVKLLQTICESGGRTQAEAAHALKGAARGIGATAVAEEAEKIERGDAAAVERLSRAIADARQAAASFLARD